MKFEKLEEIKLRTDTKQYLSNFINNSNYYLYFGVINNFFTLLLSVNKINNEFNLNFEIDSNDKQKSCIWNKIIYNKCKQSLSYNSITNLIVNIEEKDNKPLEFYGNDIYIKFPVSLDLIDWLKAENVVFEETKYDYEKISLPYINSIFEKNIKWINKLIFNNSEEHKVLLRTKSYVICKDIIWRNENNSQFYILAFPVKQIKTIRDLDHTDIDLLEEIKTQCINIAKTYGISKEKLRMYFHYHPSYYQLHLHVCVNTHPALEFQLLRNYNLDLIIEKIKIKSEYWKNTSLKFELLSGTKLYNLLKKK